jgi:hypothetical protein
MTTQTQTGNETQNIVPIPELGTKVDDGSYLASVVKELAELKEKVAKNYVEMVLSYQQYIASPPRPKNELYGQACVNDTVTVNSWAKQWLDQCRINAANNDFNNNLATKLANTNLLKPAIVAGSGPSLKKNAKELLKKAKDVPIVSCLHSYAFFHDLGIEVPYFVNLDAGDITIAEMSQGGTKNADYYWETTKDKTLIAVYHSNPEIIKRWKGKILWFSAMIPDQQVMTEYLKVANVKDEKVFFNVGGNSLGAAYYFARAIMGSMTIAFIGADFAFGYNQKFHPFDSPYDQQFSGLIPVTDVFGNRVYTWQSYFNFKCWFEYEAMGGAGNNPGIMINCTEGGILGSYAEGNMQQIIQMPLAEFIKMTSMYTFLDQVVKEGMLLF